MEILTVILLVVVVFMVGAVFLVLLNKGKRSNDAEIAKLVLDHVNSLKSDLTEGLRSVKEETNKSGEATARLLTQIGRQEEAVKMVLEQTRDLKTFQDLLRPSKSRGVVGEVLLENILKDKLAENKHYKRQYGFKSGDVVDFVLFVNDFIVPLDSKFPMESYERLVGAAPEEREAAEKAFSTSVKQKIDDIRKKYILPQEGTTDFAFMYIPSEGMYATMLSIQALMDYADAARVIPVSPSTFFAYLQTIIMGFRGMQIEESVKEIRSALSAFIKDMADVDAKVKLAGKHMKDAVKAEEDAEKSIGKIGDKLRSVVSHTQNEE